MGITQSPLTGGPVRGRSILENARFELRSIVVVLITGPSLRVALGHGNLESRISNLESRINIPHPTDEGHFSPPTRVAPMTLRQNRNASGVGGI